MGLPSKKQLHKHKRGTRKALDTLDAMEKIEKDAVAELSAGNPVEKKQSKTSKAKAKKKKSFSEKEHSPVVEDTNEIASQNIDEPDLSGGENLKNQESINDNQTAIPIEADNPMIKDKSALKADKKSIDLGNLEEAPSMEKGSTKTGLLNGSKKPSPSLQLDLTPEDATKEIRRAKTKSAETEALKEKTRSDDYDEEFEDTQKDKYLTFRIGSESFGFSITFITEIIVIHRITEVPDTPAFVRGVINLRGKVIPVIDVRHRFGMELKEYDERTCIIVVDYKETAVGLIVDTVNEVVDIPEDQIDAAPRTHSGIESSYIQGMGKIGKQVNILLNIEKVLFVDEILAKQRDLHDA